MSARAPAGIVGASLALWGAANGEVVLGTAAAVAYELLRAFRPAPSPRAAALLPAVVRACALLVLGSLAYVLATQSLPHSLYNFLRWLPLLALPLPVVALLAGGVRASHFARAARAAPPAAGEDADVDVSWAYAALVLAAAGAGNAAHAWLYPGYAVIVAWALLARVPAGRRRGAAALLAVAAALGYGLHLAISAMQGQVEEWSTELIADLLSPRADPYRERTRIGDLGKIKLSDRIVMRVAVEGARPDELLLRESTYDRYHGGEWQAARKPPRPATREGDGWRLSPGAGESRLTLRRTLPGGEGLLPLPLGTRTLHGLQAQAVEVHASGTTRVRGTPRYLAAAATYDARADASPPDAERDLEVPALLEEALRRSLDEGRLRGATPAATLAAVRAWFATQFAYSLDLGERSRGASGRTLADFLLRERKGHCEYFASATVLLLRAAGIPARYAGGYSAQEYSELEGAFIVRARHAHAWALAFVDGRWVHVDTTPARWAELEAEGAKSLLAPFLDRLSWLFDRLVLAWQELPAGGAERFAATAAGGVLAGLLAWLGVRRWRARPGKAAPREDALGRAWRGIEEAAARLGHARAPTESIRAWAARVASSGGETWRRELAPLARAYYRARFDPAAPDSAAAEFIAAARAWTPGRR